jgi:hypothetical protein
MDAAIIEVKQQDWLAKTAVMPSPIIGFKPVRLLSSSGHQDGKIQEITGPTIFAERDKNHLRKIFCLWINFSSPVTPAVLY